VRSALERVDAWARRGNFTVEDLARYRIIYGLIAFIRFNGYGNLANQPAAQFDPPPGPFTVFSSMPPEAALEGLEFVIAVLIVFLIMGFKTRATSLLLALAMTTGTGLSFSFGKIDHGIFVILVPAVMAFSGWGGAMSVDAHLAARSGRKPIEPAQWAVRLLAFMIGVAFFTAGWAKLQAGWLDLHTHAARALVFGRYVKIDDPAPLIPLLLRVQDIGILWEALDWFTVALECGLIVTVLWWWTFRVGIAFASLFHLGILQMMGIQFSANVIAYGAFVRWNMLFPTKPGSAIRLNAPAATAVGLALGAGVYYVNNSGLGDYLPGVGTELLYVGAAGGVAFLLAQVWLGIRAVRRRSRASTDQVDSLH
jgi:hypothetical protein